jgi:hypothetical protein
MGQDTPIATLEVYAPGGGRNPGDGTPARRRSYYVVSGTEVHTRCRQEGIPGWTRTSP